MERSSVIKDLLSGGSLFSEIGVDSGKFRLGWVKLPSWPDIESSLKVFLKKAEGKRHFIFIGMGGSVNGIKTLINLSKVKNIHAIDSLDPGVLEKLLSSVGDLKSALVIPISKSGTTKETQLIASVFKNILGHGYKDNFLMFADPDAFGKLDGSGWIGVEKITIQVNKNNDIGGRFSSPHTMVFLAPLILILNNNLEAMRKIWESYAANYSLLQDMAADEASKYKDNNELKLLVHVEEDMAGGFANWIIQLFQESLGSKGKDIFIKTLVRPKGVKMPGFDTLSLNKDFRDPYIYLMSYMYFLQVFTAALAYYKSINFVDQPYVEVYKKELKNLEGKTIEDPVKIKPEDLKKVISGKIKAEHEFIDCVLFFDAEKGFMDNLQSILSASFKDRIVSIFIGSDWNHHSYQAAFGDKKTLFVIATAGQYETSVGSIDKKILEQNIWTLKAISYAT